jgi:hypothetical protein
MVVGDLDQRDAYPVRILDPHFQQAPGFPAWHAGDGHPGRGQPRMLGVDVTHLQTELEDTPGIPVHRLPGNLEEALPQEENQPGIVGRAELATDGQAEDIAIETATAPRTGRAEQDPAVQYLHHTMVRVPGQSRASSAGFGRQLKVSRPPDRVPAVSPTFEPASPWNHSIPGGRK